MYVNMWCDDKNKIYILHIENKKAVSQNSKTQYQRCRLVNWYSFNEKHTEI